MGGTSMTALLYIIPVLIFGGMLLLILGIWRYVSSLKSRRDLLKKIADSGQEQSVTETSVEGNRVSQIFLNITQRLGGLGKPKSEEEISHLRKRFLQAGSGQVQECCPVLLRSKGILCHSPSGALHYF